MVDNPMKKTLLALGFLKGDVVDDWVDVQHNWINQKRTPTDPNTNHVQVPSTDLIFWTHFITEFNQAFADSAEKQNASTELHHICYGSRLALAYVYLYDVLLVTFSKCQPRWHVTVSTSYIKRTAFLVIVVARIPLRQSYSDYD